MNKKCTECEYKKTINAYGGFSFLGCFYGEYRGKWVREIKECPKEKP